ncbi:LysR family transcriptional regulator [Paraburkholderia acidicola]|uniref:LysR family transcriptional regulator n=1 Tax=Paraburkholderia acidicola TaxID=1912599 RepID=A0A2A4ERU1_9BURK|nr:LysR family transcriptional regulator [Paraburkholderia acidicola]PCE23407.1 LysR family transcriptional regulator [Paraburkholderia acidicola]
MTVKNATLRQLKTFETVARRLSFSRAANELHLSPPAVSTQIKHLEEHAGVALFEQLGKKIYLTPAGQEMLHHSRAIIHCFREAEETLAKIRSLAGGNLSVGVISTGGYHLPRLLAGFSNQNEAVELDLRVENHDGLLCRLEENRIDLAIMVDAPAESKFISTPFAPHAFFIVASPQHSQVGKQHIDLSDLRNERFIVREEGSDTWYAMQQCFNGRLALNDPLEISNTEAIKQAVIAGMGISFLSAHTVTLELQAGVLAVLDVEGFPVLRKWHVVHRADKQLAPVAQAFKAFLLAEGATHAS